MNRREVWKRLLWKELREDRWPLGIAFLAMTALYALAGAYRNPESPVGQALAVVAAGTVHLALAIWGATRGDSRRGSTQFELTHLPTSPMLEWAASVAVPTLAAAVLGLWYGFLVQNATGMASTIPMPVLGAVDLALTYAVCYFIASLASLWAGVLIGMAQLMGGTLIPVWQNEMTTDTYMVLFVARTLAASLIGALILAALYRKASPAAQKGAAVGAAVLILYGPVAVLGLPTWFRELKMPERGPTTAAISVTGPSPYVTPDKAIEVDYIESGGRRSVPFVRVRDHARGRTCTRVFDWSVETIGALRDGRVFLAQQIPGSKTISIIEWDYLSSKALVRARFVTRQGALSAQGDPSQGDYVKVRQVSPDGRYVLLGVGGLIGTTGDVWAVDLKTGSAKAALLSGPYLVSVAWTKNRVLLGGAGGASQIDLRTLQGRTFTIPKAQEAAR